jgi:hypothetical protein
MEDDEAFITEIIRRTTGAKVGDLNHDKLVFGQSFHCSAENLIISDQMSLNYRAPQVSPPFVLTDSAQIQSVGSEARS